MGRGTRPGGKASWEAGKAEDEMTANPRNRTKVVFAGDDDFAGV